jgi:hypothetical protein
MKTTTKKPLKLSGTMVEIDIYQERREVTKRGKLEEMIRQSLKSVEERLKELTDTLDQATNKDPFVLFPIQAGVMRFEACRRIYENYLEAFIMNSDDVAVGAYFVEELLQSRHNLGKMAGKNVEGFFEFYRRAEKEEQRYKVLISILAACETVEFLSSEQEAVVKAVTSI